MIYRIIIRIENSSIYSIWKHIKIYCIDLQWEITANQIKGKIYIIPSQKFGEVAIRLKLIIILYLIEIK